MSLAAAAALCGCATVNVSSDGADRNLPYAIKAGGNPRNFKVVDNRLFIFGDGKAKDYWELDQKRNIELGDRHWEEEMKDAYWRTQSYKRWIFKVPHYKTGAALEVELQARKAGK
jgi:hypothetical protein